MVVILASVGIQYFDQLCFFAAAKAFLTEENNVEHTK